MPTIVFFLKFLEKLQIAVFLENSSVDKYKSQHNRKYKCNNYSEVEVIKIPYSQGGKNKR